jgi:hypothetical protein
MSVWWLHILGVPIQTRHKFRRAGLSRLTRVLIDPIFARARGERASFALVLARPRLRTARGIRQFDSAGRGAAGFSGLANGGTEILIRGKCLGVISILRLFFQRRVPPGVPPIKIK